MLVGRLRDWQSSADRPIGYTDPLLKGLYVADNLGIDAQDLHDVAIDVVLEGDSLKLTNAAVDSFLGLSWMTSRAHGYYVPGRAFRSRTLRRW